MIPIVFSVDHNFVMPTGVAIHSLLNSGEDYKIFIIIDDDVTKQDQFLLHKEIKRHSPNSELAFISNNKIFADAFLYGRFTQSIYNRLQIPWLFPDFEKIFYCDSDIIFHTPLKNLYDSIDLKDNYIAAVSGSYNGNKKMCEYIESLGLNVDKYINAGFLLINCELQRKDCLLELYKELSKTSHSYLDQDIINIVCRNKIQYLSENYNLKPTEVTAQDLEKNYILHYRGDKPWETFTGCWIEWWDNYKSSTFYDPSAYINIGNNITKVMRRGKKAVKYLESPEQKGFNCLTNKLPFLKEICKKVSEIKKL